MSVTRKQHVRTIAGCLAVYAVIFTVANADVIGRWISTPAQAVTTVPAGQPDAEALADEDYFNSPQVDRAMSLDDPLPYNALARENDASMPTSI